MCSLTVGSCLSVSHTQTLHYPFKSLIIMSCDSTVTVDSNNIWSTLMQSTLLSICTGFLTINLVLFQCEHLLTSCTFVKFCGFFNATRCAKTCKSNTPPVAADPSLLHQIEWDSLPRGVANHGQCFNEIRAAVVTSFPHVAPLLSFQTSVLVSKCRPIYKLCEGASAHDCCTNGRSCNEDPIPSFCYR